MELTEMVWRIKPVVVAGSGRWAGEQFLASEVVAVMSPGSGHVAWFLFGGRRLLRSRDGLAKWPARFESEDPLVAEHKLAGRRIAAAAHHKSAGDTAGRRAS